MNWRHVPWLSSVQNSGFSRTVDDEEEDDDDDDDEEYDGDGDGDDGCLGIGSVNARATLQLADPKVNQPAEYELTRGPFEYGGTWAPYE